MLTILSSQKWLRSKGIDIRTQNKIKLEPASMINLFTVCYIKWQGQSTGYYMNPEYKSRDHPTWAKWKFKHMSKSQTSHEYEMKFVFVYLNE